MPVLGTPTIVSRRFFLLFARTFWADCSWILHFAFINFQLIYDTDPNFWKTLWFFKITILKVLIFFFFINFERELDFCGFLSCAMKFVEVHRLNLHDIVIVICLGYRVLLAVYCGGTSSSVVKCWSYSLCC